VPDYDSRLDMNFKLGALTLDDDGLVYQSGSKEEGKQQDGQWCGWRRAFPKTEMLRVSFQVLFVGSVPPPSANLGVKLHGQLHNGWLADCRPDEWCDVSVEGPPQLDKDGNLILLIFDTMGGPRTVKVRELKCESFDLREQPRALVATLHALSVSPPRGGAVPALLSLESCG